MHGLLKEMGSNQAEEAEDGAVALNMMKLQKFDSVVCDISRPNLSGFEFLRAVKADENIQHVPELMVTADVRKEGVVPAAQSAAAGHVVKPFTKATLEEKVAKIVRILTAAA